MPYTHTHTRTLRRGFILAAHAHKTRILQMVLVCQKLSLKKKSSWLSYSVIEVSGVQYSDSTLPCNTWCSSQHLPSLSSTSYFSPFPVPFKSIFHLKIWYSYSSQLWHALISISCSWNIFNFYFDFFNTWVF